jgi:MFS family permease
MFWSEETFRIFGYDKAVSATVDMVLQRVHPEDLALVQRTLDCAISGGKDLDFEHRLLMPDGSVKHVHVIGHPLTINSANEVELVGTVMEISIFLFEVPTGAVADTYGRKLSLIVSFVIQGAAWMLVGAVPSFWVILFAWALWGFGETFMSGAYEAWITDEVGAERVGPVLLRGTRISYLGALTGLGLGVAIAAYDLRLAILLGGAVVGVGMLGLGPTEYFEQTRGAVTLASFFIGISKSAVFGVVVALVGCLRGMQSGRSAAAVPSMSPSSSFGMPQHASAPAQAQHAVPRKLSNAGAHLGPSPCKSNYARLGPGASCARCSPEVADGRAGWCSWLLHAVN